MNAEYVTPEQGVANFNVTTCEGMKGVAYWVSNNKCKYSFTQATFTGLEGEKPDEEGDLNIGFQLNYRSREACNSGENANDNQDGKFKFTLLGVCNKDETSENFKKF